MVDTATLGYGQEYRIACPLLPEDRTKLLAHRIRKIVQLEMVDPATEVSAQSTFRRERIEQLHAILNRHGVCVPCEGDDQPK